MRPSGRFQNVQWQRLKSPSLAVALCFLTGKALDSVLLSILTGLRSHLLLLSLQIRARQVLKPGKAQLFSFQVSLMQSEEAHSLFVGRGIVSFQEVEEQTCVFCEKGTRES